MADLSGDGALVEQATRDLLAAWDAAGAAWRDAARDEIRTHHLDPLAARAKEAAVTLDRLSTLVRQAERECR